MLLTHNDPTISDINDIKIENVRPKIEQISELPHRRAKIVPESELILDGIIFKSEIEFEDTTKPCLASTIVSSEPAHEATTAAKTTNEPQEVITYECYICGDATYKTLGSLMKNHMILHYDKRPFQCKFCSETFSYRFDLNKHNVSAHNKVAKVRSTKNVEKKHKCTVCGYSTNKLSGLTNHIRGHTGERAYSCKTCQKTFIYYSNLRRHIKTTHTRFKRHKCNFCSKEYTDLSDLNAHKNVQHFNMKPLLKYKCSVCNQPKASPTALKRHMVSHTGEKSFQCGICSKKYTTQSNLKIHERKHKNEEKPFACSFCSGRFYTKSCLKKHEMKHAGGKIKKVSRNLRTFQCYLCAFTTKTMYLLVQHFIKHNDNSSFKCNFCSKIFLQNVGLQRHLRVHSAKKQFKCNICAKMFFQDDDLRSHVQRKHTFEKPFKCSTLCSRAFYNQADLHEHEKQHAAGIIRNVSMKLRTYQCYICKRSIQHRNTIIKHIRRHSAPSGRTSFDCQICSKRYMNKSCLQKHLRKHLGKTTQMLKCKLCLRQFTEETTLANHMQRHLVRGPYWCSKCSLRFKSKDTLYFHNRKHSEKLLPPQKRKLYECAFCNFSATSEETFINHMQSHGVSLKCFVKLRKTSFQSNGALENITKKSINSTARNLRISTRTQKRQKILLVGSASESQDKRSLDELKTNSIFFFNNFEFFFYFR